MADKSVAKSKTNGKVHQFPPMIEASREWAQHGGGGATNNDVEQIGQVLAPSFGSPLLELQIKSNLDPEIEADMTFLISEGVENGEIDYDALGAADAGFATVFAITKVANSYALGGKGREQVVEVLSATGGGMRNRFRRMLGGRGGGYEGGFDGS